MIGPCTAEMSDNALNSTVATFRSEHDRNTDVAILLSRLAPEPTLSGNWCVVDVTVLGLVEVKRPQYLHHCI